MDSDFEENVPLVKRLKSEPTIAATKPPVIDDSSDEDVPLIKMVQMIKSKNTSSSSKADKPPKDKAAKSKKASNSETKSTTSSLRSQSVASNTSKSKASSKPKTDAVAPKKTKTDAVAPKKTKTEPNVPKKDAPSEDDEEEDDEYKWWEKPEWDDTVKWTTLEHAGVYFPPEYTPHGVKMLYAGRDVALEPDAEEVAGFFAALVETEHAKNPIFVKNFFEDFRAVLARVNSRHKDVIVEFEKCDFTPMFRYFEELKASRRSMSKEEKEKLKEEKKRLEDQFGWCMWDGRREKVGNFRIEPPGLFRGRGQHPKAGKLKARIRPEDVTINIGPGCRVPEPPAGSSWAGIVNNNTVGWLATWNENINGSEKYVALAATSSLKGQSDYKKFERARELKKHISRIRNCNAEELRSKEMFVRQRATALWLIDRLALRAGNEKGDDEADTVGCCSLRLEHVTLKLPTTVVFDFLGKDSIRYYNEVQVDPVIIKNLSIFMREPKKQTDPIFDRLTTAMLNKYLTELMPGLTAKVFRTFNASFTMQQELDKVIDDPNASVTEKILGYNRANRHVAILCNHQRAVPKTHEQSMERLKEKMVAIKYQRLLVKRQLRELVAKKEWKAWAIDQDESDLDEEAEQRQVEEIQRAELEKHQKKLAKLEAEGKADACSQPGSPTKKSPTRSLSSEALQKRLESLTQRLAAARHNAIDREENKTTSLGTSKINYIDPRITAAWAQLHKVPIDKMFNRSLREKFKWAMGVPETWKF